MEKIQMVDLHRQYARIKTEIDHAIEKVLTSTAFIQGPDVQEFARALAGYLDVRAVIPCANGTDALQIAMMALGFKPGDEVILPVHTYVATAEIIALLGLTPVFAEVRADSFTLDPARLEEKITPRTVAIVPVHLYGQCADMEPLLRIAQKHNLHIIEDAAQALGADYTFSDKSVKKAGTMGTIGTTSFFPSKNLGCFGDGGAIFTHDETLAAKIKMIANHGQQVKYHHDLVGVNSRLDTLQAAILQVKLPHLNDYARRRRAVADFYNRAFAGLPHVTLPWVAPYSTHVYNQYTLQIGDGRRDTLKQYLEAQGIPTMIYYPVPLHLQKAYQQAEAGPGTFPVTEKLSQTVISLPIHTEMEADQLEYIAAAITRFFKQ
jgi:UDP-2-acetamido-2-deoxy-ribo-hexuluronate aminotransferase